MALVLAVLILFAAPAPALAAAPAPAPALADDPAALLARARTARAEGRLPDALAAFDALLTRAPEHEAAMVERAQVLAWMGRTHAAVEGLRAFRARHPDRAVDADLRIAQALAWGDDTRAALETLRPWVEAGARQALLDDATYRSWQGDLAGALARLDRFLSEHPDDREARLLAARVRSWRGEAEGARAEYARALALAPGDPEARLGVAQLDAWTGRPGRARDAARPLLEGDAGRDARRLLDDLVAAEGLWASPRHVSTDTSDGLVSRLTLLAARMPLRDGHLDVEGGFSEVSLGAGYAGSSVAALGLAYPLGARLALDAGAGVRGDFGGEPGFTARGGATLRPGAGLALRLDAARALLDATPRAVELGGWLQAYDASLSWTFGAGRSTLAAGGGLAWLSAGSERRGVAVSGERRVPLRAVTLRAGFLARAFGYSETLALGFFNPESYRYGALTGGATVRRGRLLELDASLQGGYQRVNDDATRFAWGYGLSLAVGPARWPVQLTAGWTQSFAGLPVTVPEDPSEYRESTLRVGVRLHDPTGRAPF
jgi:tetratricopeptide (TPR) repeat protein